MDPLLQHKHLIVRSEINKPITSLKDINEWMTKLIKNLDMKIMMGPYSAYCDMLGNRGITCVSIIETSHCVIHIWDEVSPAIAQIDVYSCSDIDLDEVFSSFLVFEPVKIEYKFIDRKDGLMLLSEGEYNGKEEAS